MTFKTEEPAKSLYTAFELYTLTDTQDHTLKLLIIIKQLSRILLLETFARNVWLSFGMVFTRVSQDKQICWLYLK